jgi:hypothetical protein
MTDSIGTAERLARLIDEADLGGEKAVVEDPETTRAALGTYPRGHGLVSVWWD